MTEQLETERLGTFVGMGVLTPDAISSSAYGTEEMLVELVPYVGLAAFTLVIPVTSPSCWSCFSSPSPTGKS